MPKSTSLGVGKIGVDLKRENHGPAKISNQTHVPFPKTMNQMVGYIDIFVPFVWHRESNLVIQKKIAKIRTIKQKTRHQLHITRMGQLEE